MKKPRLLVLTTTFPRWSGDNEPAFVFELARHLTDTFDVCVVAPHAAGARTRETMAGIEVVRFRYAPERFETLSYQGGIAANLRQKPWKYLLVQGFMLGLFFAALSQVRQQRPDVLHAHWMIPGGGVAAAIKILFPNTHTVVTAHGSDVLQLRGRLFRALRRWVAAEVDRVTVVGGNLLGAARAEAWPTGTISIAPMGVNIPAVSKPHHGKTEAPAILCAGRLVPGKGVCALIDAFASVLQRTPTCRLTIAGDGPLRGDIEQSILQLGIGQHVRLVGAFNPDELPRLLAQADIVVLPFTQDEGLGLVAVEAMACGIPLIAGDIPAMRNLVEHGQTGLLVDGGEPLAIADTITRLINDTALQRQLGEQARLAVVGHYDWDTVAARYRGLLLPPAPDADH